jgi:5-methylthioadenosine/S-adenosylhomocysteine deaminase
VIKIEGAAYILSLDATRRILKDASILIDGQRIVRVEPRIEQTADTVIDARGCLVMPAFVNGHMHISYAHAVRGRFADDFVGRERLREVFRLQTAMTEQEEYDTTLLGIVELMKNGTVTFVDPGSTKYVDACLQAYADAGCRVVTGESLTDVPNELGLPCYAAEEAVRRTRAFIQRFDHRLDDRVRAWAMPFSPDTCTPGFIHDAAAIAREAGTGISVHHSGGHTRMLHDQGALASNMVLAHATGIDDEEVELIAQHGASVVVCPSTALKEGGLGMRKVPELLERGVNVGLGSDSANSSHYLDPVRSMYAVAVGFKEGRRDVHQMPGEHAVEMATLLGARALGMADEIGSIEPGKKADLVIFDTRRAEWRALFDPVQNLIYSADGRSVRTVIADGRVVVDGGKVLFADEAALSERVQQHGEALLARTGTSPNVGRWPIR